MTEPHNPFHSGPYRSAGPVCRGAFTVAWFTALMLVAWGLARLLVPPAIRLIEDAADWAFPPSALSDATVFDLVPPDVSPAEPSLEMRKFIAARMVLSTYLVLTPDGGHGTGVRISETEIITARHVTDGNSFVGVRDVLGRFAVAPELYDGGKALDYAVLSIPASTPGLISPVDCRAPVPGEPVTHIGNPGDTRWGRQFGIVSPIDVYPDDGSGEVELVMTVNPGSSGGPVFDADGEVIGIMTASITDGGKPGAYSLMLPSSVLCAVMGIK